MLIKFSSLLYRTGPLFAQGNYGGAPTSGFNWRIAERLDEGRPRKHTTDCLALHTDPAPVDNPEIPKPDAKRLFEICFYDTAHVARRDCMKVENIANGNLPKVTVGIVILIWLAHATFES